MHLSQLDIFQVRNLENIRTNCHPQANIIFGANGSGKTSFLESIYLLGRGRSFRHRDLRVVVNNHADELVVSGRLLRDQSATSHQLGIKRTSRGLFEARLDGKPLQTAAQLVSELPLQLIDAHSFMLLEGGPLQRRQFLDWGVFHVEHDYTNLWRRFQKTLKQRNQLLRHGRMDEDLLRTWTAELIPLCEHITRFRRQYLSSLAGHVSNAVSAFEGLGKVSLEYYCGWDEERTLADVYTADHGRDIGTKTTNHGAHRADIRIKVDGRAAAEHLSRGQIKLLVYALKLAQAGYYRENTGESCLFLLDDLPAELDYQHRRQVISYLNDLGCQYFITGVDKKDFEGLVKTVPHQMFHMEHGVVLVD
jgi:DNA replication and repair protein RecF